MPLCALPPELWMLIFECISGAHRARTFLALLRVDSRLRTRLVPDDGGDDSCAHAQTDADSITFNVTLNSSANDKAERHDQAGGVHGRVATGCAAAVWRALCRHLCLPLASRRPANNTERRTYVHMVDDVPDEHRAEVAYPFVRCLRVQPDCCISAADASVDGAALLRSFPRLRILELVGKRGVGRGELKLDMCSREAVSHLRAHKHLRELSLRNTHFSEENLRALSSAISKSRLTSLEVSKPSLFALFARTTDLFLKSACACRGLTRLVLSDCRLYDERLLVLAKRLALNPQVTWLDLSRNLFRADGAAFLLEELYRSDAAVCRLKHLDLSSNNLAGADHSIAAILISKRCALQTLVVSNVAMLSHEVAVVAAAAGTCGTLSALDVSGNAGAHGASFEAIANAIKSNRSLTDVRFDHVSVDPALLVEPARLALLRDALRSNQGLRRLSARHHSLFQYADSEEHLLMPEQAELADAICAHQGIRELRMGSLPAAFFAAALRSPAGPLRSLTAFKMQWPRDDTLSVMQLCKGIASHCSLATLDLSDCSLGESGVRVRGLAKALARNRSLRRLSVAHNGICEDMASIIDAALHNSHLELLDVSGNRLPMFVVATRVAQLLRDGSLRELRMARCSIGNRGYDALFKALRHNACLETLDISWNGAMSHRVAQNAAASLALNRTLRTLRLDCYASSYSPQAAATLRMASKKRGMLDVSMEQFEAHAS